MKRWRAQRPDQISAFEHHLQPVKWPELLSQIIKYGLKSLDPEYEGKMIGNKNLSDKDIEYILEYIKSYWPDEILNNYENGF